jgi:1-acyl-sn-glycerol-3-phosphate acyltransferase
MGAPHDRSPKAETMPPPSSQPPASIDRDASERLMQAEGADVPQLLAPRAMRRDAAEKKAGPAPLAPGAAEGLAELPSDPNLAARIRELEERLDRMISTHARERVDDDRTRESSRPSPPSPGSSAKALPTAGAEDGHVETTHDVLATDFYLRKWGRLGLRSRSEEVDEFGYDPVYEQKVLPFFEFLYEKYFRVEVHGAQHVPPSGRCLLVANHSGTLPLDGVMLRIAVRREHTQHRGVRWLAEDGIFHFPFLGSFTNRMGAVRACQENAERLLEHGALVAVFPEGMKGIGKLFRERYRLQRFGRGGFVKLCLRTRTPIVPVAIIGGEETNPMLSRVEYLTKAIGIPYLPVTPTFPLLGPAGLIPAPTKWKIFFGRMLDLEGYGAEAADDEILVGRLTEHVRGEIQGMLDHALRERRSVWFG